MSEMLSIPTFDQQNFSAYVAYPEQSSAPAIVVCQEIFGVNAPMRLICDELAKAGYIAICPDLFWRIEPHIQLNDAEETDRKRAFELFGTFDVEQGMTDLIAAVGFARRLPRCNGAVGTVGYCLGGKLAYLLLARSDVDCGVSYYGVGLENLLREMPDIRRPLLLHIAEGDEYVPTEARTKILQGVAKNPQVTAMLHPHVGHAFARPNGMHYDAAAAAKANEATAEFLAEHLTR